MTAPTISNKYNAHNINVSALTLSNVVIAANEDLYVAVGASDSTPANCIPSSIVWNGITLTQVKAPEVSADDNITVTWYRTINPGAGTHNCVVTMPGNIDHGIAATAYAIAKGRSSLLVVNGNHGDASASSPQTNTITTVRPSTLILDLFIAASSGETVTAQGQTQDFNVQDSGGSPMMFTHTTKTAIGSQTMSETPSSTGRGYTWGAIAIAPLAVGTIRTNLVQNPNLSTNANFWSLDSDWVRNATGGAISGGRFTQNSIGGFQNLTTVNDSNGYPVEHNTDYVFTFYTKLAISSGLGPLVKINGGSAFGTTISFISLGDDGGVYHRQTIAFNSGTNDLVYLQVQNNNGTLSGDYSNFHLEKAANQGAYFDGDTTDTSTHLYDWTGTAEASSSTDEPLFATTTKTFTADGTIKARNTFTFTTDAVINDPSSNLGTDLINDDMSTSPAGTIGGNASYNGVGKYVQLTPAANGNAGSIDYSKSIPHTLIFEADLYANGGADANYIYWGCSSIPSGEDSDGGGYVVAIDEYSGDDFPIQLQWRGTRLASSAFPHNVGDATKRTLKVVEDNTRILVYFNNVLLIDFTDTTRVFGGTHIGVGARTGGINAEHRVYRIHAYPFTSPWHPTAITAGLSTLTFRSMDTMKWGKDTVNNQPSSAQIIAIIKGITNTFTHLTHIAIAVPLDIDADYIPTGIVPSPASIASFTQFWTDAIHNVGLNVIFRGDFNQLERSSSGPTGNWNTILAVGAAGRFPRGTPTSAPTDARTTWLGKIRRLIVDNPNWYKDGDIFAPMPERTENNTEVVTISTITRVGTTATITTPFNHNVGNQQPVRISGATQSAYNGSFIATLLDDTHFSIQVAGSPTTPATGTPQLQFGVSVFTDENSFIDNTGSGVNANYAQFFEDVKTVADSAFSSIGKNVKTGFSSNNYSEVNSGWIPTGLMDFVGRTEIDHYGVTHTPGEMYNDLVNLFNAKGHIIDQQEWSDYWNGSMATQTRLDYLTDFYNMLVQLFNEGIYDLFNYWGGWVGGTGEGILVDNSVGGSFAYSVNTFGQLLASYFNPIAVVTPPTVFGTSDGYVLDGVSLKSPKTFVREFVYTKTDFTMLTGKSMRDTSNMKEKYTLGFENLTKAQVDALNTIIEEKKAVTFTVFGHSVVNIQTTVWPYIGAIVYDTVGGDYRAKVQLELIEVT